MYLSKVGHFGCLTFYFLKKSSKIHKTLNKYVYTFRLKDIFGPKTYKVLFREDNILLFRFMIWYLNKYKYIVLINLYKKYF